MNQQRISIEHDTQVGEARRLAALLSRQAGLSETSAGKVALAVNELGSNVTKHAGRGELLLRILPGESRGIEIVALDKGPGMDVDRALRDGHSTAGTRGEGLGAVLRLADEFDVWSAAGQGAAVLARVWESGKPKTGFQMGAVCVPIPSETVCGDGWEADPQAATLRLLIADGLGHGPIAQTAAQAAAASFRQRSEGTLEALVQRLHEALRSTRGAAVGVAELDLKGRTLRFCGVGNVAATVEVPGEKARGLLSHNGIAGHEARRIQAFGMQWPARGVLVLHSDGLSSSFRLEAYPGLALRHAALVAALLYRDFRRRTDDCTVVVVKET